MKSILCAAALAATVGVVGHAAAFSASGTYQVTNKVDGSGSFTNCAVLQSAGAAGPYRDTGYVSFPGTDYTGTYVVARHQFYAAISSPTNGDSVAFTTQVRGPTLSAETLNDFFPGQPALIVATGSFTAVRDKSCTNDAVKGHALFGH